MNGLKDFPDWLSPMLVKELRQGLRSRFFAVTFMLIQAVMSLMAITGLNSASNDMDTDFSTGFFWTTLCIPMLIFLPLAGLGSVVKEKRENTLELIRLTRLTSRRILVGKWAALSAQGLLFVCSVLPYAVLRYFFGQVDVAYELMWIGVLMLASSVLTGIAVGASPLQNRFTQVIWVIGAILSLQLVPALLFGLGRRPFGTIFSSGAASIIFALLSVSVMVVMIEIGAGKIGTLAENHSTVKRLAGLFSVGLTLGMAAFFRVPDVKEIAMLFLAFLALDVLCEEQPDVATVYRPFIKFGIPGRLVAMIFGPGWISGLVFLAICVLPLALWAYPSVPGHRTWDPRELFIPAISTLLFGAAIVQVALPSATQKRLLFFLTIIVPIAVTAFFFAFRNSISPILYNSISLLPPAAFIRIPESKDFVHSALCGATGALSLVILLWKMRMNIRSGIPFPLTLKAQRN